MKAKVLEEIETLKKREIERAGAFSRQTSQYNKYIFLSQMYYLSREYLLKLLSVLWKQGLTELLKVVSNTRKNNNVDQLYHT